jgi:hypothetical protein
MQARPTARFGCCPIRSPKPLLKAIIDLTITLERKVPIAHIPATLVQTRRPYRPRAQPCDCYSTLFSGALRAYPTGDLDGDSFFLRLV